MLRSTLSDSFKYLCYGSTPIRNILNLTVRGLTLESDVYRHQILTTEVDLRAVGVKIVACIDMDKQ